MVPLGISMRDPLRSWVLSRESDSRGDSGLGGVGLGGVGFGLLLLVVVRSLFFLRIFSASAACFFSVAS